MCVSQAPPHTAIAYIHNRDESKRRIFNVIVNANDEKSQQFIWITQNSFQIIFIFYPRLDVAFLYVLQMRDVALTLSQFKWIGCRYLNVKGINSRLWGFKSISTMRFLFWRSFKCWQSFILKYFFFFFITEMDDMFLEYNTNTIYVLNATYRYGVSNFFLNVTSWFFFHFERKKYSKHLVYTLILKSQQQANLTKPYLLQMNINNQRI